MSAPALRTGAETLAAPLPPLLAEAEHLAQAVLPGSHGRRRVGQGDEFWQYRPAHGGDPAHRIDWRRSARSDTHYVREREWQAAQSVLLWVDPSAAMRFASPGRVEKRARAQLLALALAVLLVRGGERVGLVGGPPPRSGGLQLMRLAQALAAQSGPQDHGTPGLDGARPHIRAVFLSDFLGPLTPLRAALAEAADRGVRGALVQVLDPAEETFPFEGRTIFESMSGHLRHETLKASELRAPYCARLSARKAELAELALSVGWHATCHHSDDAPLAALLWLYRALEPVRG
ncbi:uncharacterized protein DUF58 [Rhodovulum imhoffii]|uniref:Uncharacterized protein DUF58 n=1 Tax=Rhodovulum imhoffii TaxID=365340 RepID=A0A2T5BS24_9RHOB|nr:DUF58 domain-containing protein [Rhodovulum imhoffii]MBK5934696.1 DUF58 domain-containing protein [Rhodovulum imhoffii]PTN02119.1 uncharacterized protein DUF58 [Rhodovulum imhoffii]